MKKTITFIDERLNVITRVLTIVDFDEKTGRWVHTVPKKCKVTPIK